MSKKKRLPPVTDEQYMECNEWNRIILEEFLMQPHFSKDTRKQYTSAGKVFLKYLHDRVQNKPIHELKARDGMLFQTWLNSLGLSSSAIRLRRSLVSSLCNYIELYYGEDYPMFRNIFPKGVAHVPHSFVNDKEPLTIEEYNLLVDTLEEQEEYQMLLYVLLSYTTGARRSEINQVLKECVEYDKVKGKNFYATNVVRGKGGGEAGKQFRLFFDDKVMDAMKKWMEQRGEDDEPALFVRKLKDGTTTPLARETFNYWCSNKFSEIVGTRVSPHMFRRSRATHMVTEEGMSLENAKKLLNHNSTETTSIYVIRDDSDELDDIF